MEDDTSPSHPTPFTPPTPPSAPVPKSGSHSIIPWIISGILLVLVIIFGVIILVFAVGNGSIKESIQGWLNIEEDSEDADEDGDTTTGDSETADDSNQDQADTDTDDTDDVDEDPSDITSLWSDYYNDSFYIGFKYPQDLVVEEDITNPSFVTVTLTGGMDTTVVTAWITSMSTLDGQLSNMLANQCTDDITFSTVTYGSLSFRKAVDVPLQSCLAALGITRDQELAAYGVLLPGEVVLTIRNDAMNQEQIEALLSTVYAE
jgi:hypothetical protein